MSKFKQGIPRSQYKRSANIEKQRAMARQRRVNAQRNRAVQGGFRARLGEKKGVDTILTLSPVLDTTSTNGSSFVINLVQPGTASYNRVGRKIYCQSVRIKGVANHTYTPTVTTGDMTSNVLRMVVVWDAQPSGVLPAFDTIFGTTTQAGTEGSKFLDPVRYDNMGRFAVLRDTIIPMQIDYQNAFAGSSNISIQKYCFDEYVKLSNRETVYSGQSSPCTIADISTGGLYIYFRSDVAAAGISQVAITEDSFARLRYTD